MRHLRRAFDRLAEKCVDACLRAAPTALLPCENIRIDATGDGPLDGAVNPSRRPLLYTPGFPGRPSGLEADALLRPIAGLLSLVPSKKHHRTDGRIRICHTIATMDLG